MPESLFGENVTEPGIIAAEPPPLDRIALPYRLYTAAGARARAAADRAARIDAR